MRVVDRFDAAADLYPDRPFLKAGKVVRTYRESAGRTIAIARSIRRHSPRGTRIAVWASNSPDVVEVMYGIMRANAVFVPLNARNSVDDNVEILNRYDVGGLFIDAHYLVQCDSLRQRVASLRFVTVIGSDDRATGRLEEWLEAGADPLPEEPFSRDDLWALYSTSGTTGRPKGVRHTHLTSSVSMSDLLTCLGYRDPVVHLVVSPVTHMAGIMTMSLTSVGATHVMCPSTGIEDIIDTMAREEVEVVYLPPTLIYMLLGSGKELSFPKLRHVVAAGAPLLPGKAVELVERLGPKLINVYAQAEGIGAITCLRPEDYFRDGKIDEERIGSVGRASPPRILAVMDDSGALLPKRERGEIVVRSFTMMDGFQDDPVATAEVNLHGWHHTGDIGWLNEQGFLTLVDRKKDMIISGGFNVFSVEVENALLSHPAVAEAAVVGVAHEKWGEAVVAVVERKAHQEASAAELIQHCKARIGSVKSPKAIHFVDSLPRNNNGKIEKKVIRQRLAERATAF